MKKVGKVILGVLFLLIISYLIGPTPEAFESIKELPKVSEIDAIEQYVDQLEADPNIKPGNNARIVWASDTIKQKTKYSILYLHGFSASEREGAPVHENIAKRFGCNLYLARLQGHGIKGENELLDMTSSGLYASAQEALAIAQKLGEKVIIMGTSTGATLALMLAAENESIAGLAMYSPNIEIYDPTAYLLNKPWGKEIATLVLGGKYKLVDNTMPEYPMYWNTKYRLEALVELQELLEASMTKETFEKIKVPVFLGYWYKNEEIQDKTVSVKAMQLMFDQLGTSPDFKEKHAYAEAGSHVICSNITSNQFTEVEENTASFLTNVIGLQEKP